MLTSQEHSSKSILQIIIHKICYYDFEYNNMNSTMFLKLCIVI